MKRVIIAVIVTWCVTLFPADSLKVYWGMMDQDGSEYTPEELSNLTFKAWISNYGKEVRQ